MDLVTLDLNMPGFPGIDVLKEIKKLQPDIEVIIVTGYGTPSNAQDAIRHGAGDFISKPFNVADIIATVNKAFERLSYNLNIKGLIRKARGLHPSLAEHKDIFPR
jgi:DNA-binding NtrC family response regulator